MAIFKARTNRWTDADVAGAFNVVRSELQEKFGADQHPERLPYILRTIDELAASNDADAQLRLVVMIISGLAWNLREGAPSGVDHARLIDLGREALKTNGVPVEGSKISYLHGDIRNLESQCVQVQGDHWQAFWLTTIAARSTLPNTVGEHQDQLATASRFFRLGHLSTAETIYRELLTATKDPSIGARATIELARLQRLRGEFAGCLGILESANQGQFVPDEQVEVEFEKIRAIASRDGDYRPIMQAVRNGKTHYLPTYVIESILWANAVRGNHLIDQAYSLRSLAKNSTLRPQEHKVFFECAVCIVEIGDKEIAVNTRLEQLGRALTDAKRLGTIDQEMLVLVAAARALSKSRFWQLASACLREYQAISYKVTNYRSGDVFNLAQDMLDANWFQGSIGESSKAA